MPVAPATVSITAWGLITLCATWVVLANTGHIAGYLLMWLLMPQVSLPAIAVVMAINIALAARGPNEGKVWRCVLASAVIVAFLVPLWFVCFAVVLYKAVSF